MRGYNLSSKPTDVEAYQISHLVEDVHALIAHLGYEKCVLVGHDWGGVVAWAFAMRYPEYLTKLIIINAPHPAIFARELRENPAQQRASEYMLMFRGESAEATLAAETTRCSSTASSHRRKHSATKTAPRTSPHGPNPAR